MFVECLLVGEVMLNALLGHFVKLYSHTYAQQCITYPITIGSAYATTNVAM